MHERDLLRNFLNECPTCQRFFVDNASLFAIYAGSKEGPLSDEEAAEILVMLNDYHRAQAHEEVMQ